MSDSNWQTASSPEPAVTARMDELLNDFVDRAGELVSAQQRMQGLLNAVVALAEDLSLEAVLLRVVRSACQLLEAEYGALGVIGSDHGLSHFITVGIEDELARKIGPLPTGHGVLGLLIRDPKPLRLHDLSQHPDAYGFPKHHPQMKSFLGVPIRVRDAVFGNLYLTQKIGGGDFTDEDEGLAEAFAAAAGVAIENARLYDEARRRTAWLQACMDVTGKVMGDEEEVREGQNEGLDMIAARALQESSASLALILVPEEDSDLYRVAGAAGSGGLEWVGRLSSFDPRAVEAILATGQAAAVDDASAALSGGPMPDDGRLLVVDLSARGTHHGLLVLVREGSAGTFSKTDVEMGAVFGSHVALALELARAHRMREQLAVFTDRDRIARDLHDLVIQRLFAAGLSIQSLRRLITGETAARTLQTVTAELDEVIRELRNTIYSLNGSPMERELLSSRVLKAVRGAARSLGFVPRLTLTGPIDAIGDEETASNILAVVTEGLSNAVRHSGADSIRVSVSVEDGFVYVRVQDNGAGFSVRTPGNGMTNMQHRARKLGGAFEVTSSPDSGTALTWTAPVF